MMAWYDNSFVFVQHTIAIPVIKEESEKRDYILIKELEKKNEFMVIIFFF